MVSNRTIVDLIKLMHIIPLWVDGSEHRIGKSGAPKRSYPNVAFSCKRCAISTRIVAQ